MDVGDVIATNAAWLFVVLGGPVVLAALIAYALLRRRRLTNAERSTQIRETERGYDETRPGR
jgi:hypothetical protein